MITNPQRGQIYRAVSKTHPGSDSLRTFLSRYDGCDTVVFGCSSGDHIHCGSVQDPTMEWDFRLEDLEPLSENEAMRVRYEWGIE